MIWRKNKDGTLIERIIEVANEARVPLLPVHDEFIVREKDRVFIQVVLERVFRHWIGEKGQFGTLSSMELTVAWPPAVLIYIHLSEVNWSRNGSYSCFSSLGFEHTYLCSNYKKNG